MMFPERFLGETPMTRDNAKADCESRGLSLVAPKNTIEAQLVNDLDFDIYWTLWSSPDESATLWDFQDGYGNFLPDHSKIWKLGEPNGHGSGGMLACGYYYGSNYGLSDIAGDNMNKYICDIPPVTMETCKWYIDVQLQYALFLPS